MKTGQPNTFPSLLDRLEKFIKLAGTIAAVTAAIGLPAVYVQYSNLGIPTSFITKEQIIQAGILPGLLFLFVGAYVLLLIREYEEGSSGVGVFMMPGILFAPIPVAGVIVIFIGLYAATTWLWWVMLYPVFWLIDMEWARQVHFWAANCGAFLNLAGPFVWQFIPDFVKERLARWRLVAGFKRFYGFHRRARKRTRNEGETRPANDLAPGEPTNQSQKDNQRKKEESEFWLFAGLAAGFAAYLLVGLFAIRWYLQQLDISPGPLAETSQILLLVVLGTLGLFIFFLLVMSWKYMRSGNQGKRLLVTSLNISLVLGLSVSSVWWYSTTLYPRIPAALGGGKPEAVVVWMDAEDLPVELRAALQGVDCRTTGAIVRCSTLQLIHRSDEDVIFATPGDGARVAVLVPRNTIKALSW